MDSGGDWQGEGEFGDGGDRRDGEEMGEGVGGDGGGVEGGDEKGG